jgi:hypothetical protein
MSKYEVLSSHFYRLTEPPESVHPSPPPQFTKKGNEVQKGEVVIRLNFLEAGTVSFISLSVQSTSISAPALFLGLVKK